MIKAKQILAGVMSAAMVLTSAGVTTVASTVSVFAEPNADSGSGSSSSGQNDPIIKEVEPGTGEDTEGDTETAPQYDLKLTIEDQVFEAGTTEADIQTALNAKVAEIFATGNTFVGTVNGTETNLVSGTNFTANAPTISTGDKWYAGSATVNFTWKNDPSDPLDDNATIKPVTFNYVIKRDYTLQDLQKAVTGESLPAVEAAVRKYFAENSFEAKDGGHTDILSTEDFSVSTVRFIDEAAKTGEVSFTATDSNVTIKNAPFNYTIVHTYEITKPANVKIPYTGNKLDAEIAEAFKTITLDNEATLTLGEDFEIAEISGYGKGAQTVTFKTLGEYANDSIKDVTISVEEDTEEDTYEMSFDSSVFVYNGSAWDAEAVKKADAITVMKDGNTNIYPADTIGSAQEDRYTIEVTPVKEGEATNAGSELKITVKVYAEVSGETPTPVKTFEETVTIAKADLSTVTLTGTYEHPVYDGTAKEVEFTDITFMVGEEPTSIGKYTVGAFTNNINAGDKAQATVTAASDNENFTGSGTVYFTIDPYPISNAHTLLEVTKDNYKSVEFNGEVQKPEVTVDAYFNKEDMSTPSKLVKIPATEYEVVYLEDSKDAGNYSVSIKAKEGGNLRDSETKPEVQAYTIEKADLSKLVATAKKEVPAEELTHTSGWMNTAQREKLLQYFDLTVNGYEITADDLNTQVVSGDLAKADEKITLKLTPGDAGHTSSDSLTGAYTLTFTTTVALKYTLGETYKANAVVGTAITYDGTEKRPAAEKLGTLTLISDETGLAPTLDPTVYEVLDTYENNVNAGTATATIRAKAGSGYVGTATVEFEIAKAEITGEVTAVTGVKEKGDYFVGAVIADATATVGGKTYTKDEVTVKVSAVDSMNNITELTVFGKGNYYTAEAGLKYTCKIPANILMLDDAVITGTLPAGLKAYNEATIKEYITVTLGESEVEPGGYTVSEITGEGKVGTTLKFTISGVTPVIGKKTDCEVKVEARDINDFAEYIEVTDEGLVYDGTEKKPGVEVVLPEEITNVKPLVEDIAFTVSYSENINAGTATATLTGKGDYKGTASATFTIAKATLTNTDHFNVTGVESVEYKKGLVDDLSDQLSLTAKENEKYVFAASDYKISLVPDQKDVAKNDKVKYNVEFLAESTNYNASATPIVVEAYPVAARTIKDAEITVETKTFEYKGKDTPAITKSDLKELGEIVVTFEGDELKKNVDYTLVVEGNVTDLTSGLEEKDQPYLVVNYMGNYAGKQKVALAIVPAENVINIYDVNLVAPTGSAAVYNGTQIVPEQVDGGKQHIVDNNDEKGYYEVVYTNADGKVVEPIKAGKYTATVVATKEFGGVTGNSITFEITRRVISAVEFEKLVDGSAVWPSTGEGRITAGTVAYAAGETVAPKLSGKYAEEFEAEVPDYTTYKGGEAQVGKTKIHLKDSSNFVSDETAEVEFVWTRGTITKDELLAMFTTEPNPVSYTGSAVRPNIVALSEDVSSDWVTVKYYEDNIDISEDTAKVYVKITVPADAKYVVKDENTTAVLSVVEGFYVFEITKAPSTISIENKTEKYTGSPIGYTPEEATVDGSEGAITFEYYAEGETGALGKEPVDAGVYTVYAHVDEDETHFGADSDPATLTIETAEFSGSDVTVAESADCYEGPAKPEVSVRYEGGLLQEGTHYTVEYTNNTVPGIGTATIRGIGNFDGSLVERTFTVTNEMLEIAHQYAAATLEDAEKITEEAGYPADSVEAVKDAVVALVDADLGTDADAIIDAAEAVEIEIKAAEDAKAAQDKEVAEEKAAEALAEAEAVLEDEMVPTANKEKVEEAAEALEDVLEDEGSTAEEIMTAVKELADEIKAAEEAKMAAAKEAAAAADQEAEAVIANEDVPAAEKAAVEAAKAALDAILADEKADADDIFEAAGELSKAVDAAEEAAIEDRAKALEDAADTAAIADEIIADKDCPAAEKAAVEAANAALDEVVEKEGVKTAEIREATDALKKAIDAAEKAKQNREVLSLEAYFIADQIYNGKALTPGVNTVLGTFAKADWADVKYYDSNVNVSNQTAKAYVVVTVPEGDEHYLPVPVEGYITFKILPAQIGDQKITVESATYTGEALTPAVTVKDADGKLLDLDKDYVIEGYENNINAGTDTATVTIKGIKNYDGEKPVSFTILPADIAEQTITVKSATYTGKALTPAVTVKDADGKLLDLDKDYTVSYTNNINVGKGTVTVKGIKNYAGSTEKQFTIKRAKQTVKATNPANGATKSVKAGKSFTIKATATKEQGTAQFKKVNGKKVISISSTGKVTVKSTAKAGTYTLKYKVRIKKTANYKTTSYVTRTVKVKVTK